MLNQRVLSPPASSEADLELADLAQAEDRINFRRNREMRTLIFRSLLLSIAIAAFCGVAGAVGPQGKDLHRDRRDIRADTRDIRHDRRDIRKDERERRADVRDLPDDKKEGVSKQQLQQDRKDIAGDTRDIRKDERDVKKDRRDRKADARDARKDKREPPQYLMK